jgi:uncharacterized protein YjbJ (UPF0337 family)
MNKNDNEMKNWSDIKEKIKEKWSKFTNEEIESFKENLDKIATKIQQVYGFAKERAEEEYKEFKEFLSMTLEGDGKKEESKQGEESPSMASSQKPGATSINSKGEFTEGKDKQQSSSSSAQQGKEKQPPSPP